MIPYRILRNRIQGSANTQPRKHLGDGYFSAKEAQLLEQPLLTVWL